jgi:hypothetical protein
VAGPEVADREEKMIEHHDAANEASRKATVKHREPDVIPNFRKRWQEKPAASKSKKKVDCGELFWSWAAPKGSGRES